MIKYFKKFWFPLTIVLLLSCTAIFAGDDLTKTPVDSSLQWWAWALILFCFTFFLGILAVVAGVGGGTLFVPIVSGLFPFHLDFIRGGGLLVALTGALSAGPTLLRKGLADLRLTIPLSVMVSISSIFGAQMGLALPVNVLESILGSLIIMIIILMILAKKADFPIVPKPGKISAFFDIKGAYFDESLNKEISWHIHRTPLGMLLFLCIGFTAGMFGIGAGWANVPVLNLLMGAPLKVATGTSIFILSTSGASAAWVYINQAAEQPLIAVPAVAGIMLGTKIGVKILAIAKPKIIKIIIIVSLSLAGTRTLLKGLGIWE